MPTLLILAAAVALVVVVWIATRNGHARRGTDGSDAGTGIYDGGDGSSSASDCSDLSSDGGSCDGGSDGGGGD